MKYSIMLLIFSLLSACASKRIDANAQSWLAISKDEIFEREKQLFKQRSGGKSLCSETGLNDFLRPSTITPSKLCIYPSSSYGIGYEGGEKVLKQAFRTTKVMQVDSRGFLLESALYTNDKVIYVLKTSEEGFVDGAFFDNVQNQLFYEFVGTHEYQTMLGQKTVYKFRRYDDQFKEHSKGLKYYGPYNDFIIQNQVWKNARPFPPADIKASTEN
ncbi:MAG: hypothetical protein KF789_10465 [Bdellovibrionaceae bacterium]|nr:hypothetical protein [Pseudobdellovibrionaceae bacterium]